MHFTLIRKTAQAGHSVAITLRPWNEIAKLHLHWIFSISGPLLSGDAAGYRSVFDTTAIRTVQFKDRKWRVMNNGIVVTALDARSNFGKLLRRVEDEGRSLVIEKRGSPRAVLLSIRDYVKLSVPVREVLRIIGQGAK